MATGKTAAKRGGSSKRNQDTRERILSTFSARAQKSGIRGVKMGTLAAELHMSATTLYKHFASKEELVYSMVLRWAEDLSASDAALPDDGVPRTADEHMLLWAEAWAESMSRYTPEFWQDLHHNYPEAWDIFHREVRRRKHEGAKLLRPHLADNVAPQVAFAVLDLLIEQAANPRLANRLGLSRGDTIRTAIRIWRHGALRLGDP